MNEERIKEIAIECGCTMRLSQWKRKGRAETYPVCMLYKAGAARPKSIGAYTKVSAMTPKNLRKLIATKFPTQDAPEAVTDCELLDPAIREEYQAAAARHREEVLT